MRIFLLSFIILAIPACSDNEYDTFSDWYDSEAKGSLPSKGKSSSVTVTSPTMKVDRIFRSMEGPFTIKDFDIDADVPMVWLKGYRTIIKDSKGNRMAESFMCHNNLNLKYKEQSPWKVKTLGSKTRLFTLTEGQTRVMLPDGFGVPITPSQKLELVSQVLNHNEHDINKNLVHEIELFYQEEYEGSGIKPLYQQSIFVVKQTAGPTGQYGTPPGEGVIESNDTCHHNHKHGPHCAPQIATDDYNPFQDKYGRKYTGHWTIDPNYEELHTNVTPMLALDKDRKVHYIGVHVHPFCESLELWDITANKSVWKAGVENYTDKIGIKHIDHYSSKAGILLHHDHQYELISIYRNKTGDDHTAMATMFLYLEED